MKVLYVWQYVFYLILYRDTLSGQGTKKKELWSIVKSAKDHYIKHVIDEMAFARGEFKIIPSGIIITCMIRA